MKLLTTLLGIGTASVAAQQIDPNIVEVHPPLPMQVCSSYGGCKTENTSVVLEFDRRPLRMANSDKECMVDGVWDATACPDNTTCAQNCVAQSVDYAGNRTVSTYKSDITFNYWSDVHPRVMLLSSDPTKYRMFHLLNQEFSFDINIRLLFCGVSAAVYFVPMQEDGGSSAHPTSVAGAQYGTGYCDAKCGAPRFVDGVANFGMPTPSGKYGMCCAEMDVWEGNAMATAFTSHPSSKSGIYKCSTDSECGYDSNNTMGVTDSTGCIFNPYANGDKMYYGNDFLDGIYSRDLLTVTTQFITDDNTPNGKLVEIRRLYKQGNYVIDNSIDKNDMDSITEAFCAQSPTSSHQQHGGLASLGEEMRRGMVLAMEIRRASASLDQKPNGPCDAPDTEWFRNSEFKISNIRVGDIGSTYAQPPHTAAPPTLPPFTETVNPNTRTPTPSPSGCNNYRTTCLPPHTPPPRKGAPLYGQCGGIGFTGLKRCAQGTCTKMNDWYSQCV